MRRKDREITTPEEVRAIIDGASILHLALLDGEYPYVVPLHYGYEYVQDRLCFYMHCAKEGHLPELVAGKPKACVELDIDGGLISGGDVACRYGAEFASVIARGRVEPISDPTRRCDALRCLMRHLTGREFEISEEAASSVTVLCFTADSVTAKAKRRT